MKTPSYSVLVLDATRFLLIFLKNSNILKGGCGKIGL